MKTQFATFHNESRISEVTEAVAGRKSVLAPVMGLLWAVMLVLPAFGASAVVVFTTLHSFTCTNDGANHVAALVHGSNDYFYCTSYVGGTNKFGTLRLSARRWMSV
jgi:hypothetical protein